jgi:hypothetical protein
MTDRYIGEVVNNVPRNPTKIRGQKAGHLQKNSDKYMIYRYKYLTDDIRPAAAIIFWNDIGVA